MNIQKWLEIYQSRFDSPYELMFAKNVLASVKDLNLSTVKAQYHFTDLDGKSRYCDFVIQEGSIRIAIEVDGYDKRNTGQGMSHSDFVDWQRRQAALTAAGWHVLRFANRDVRNEPARCQRYIELLLRDQRSKSQHQAKLETAISRMSQELKAAQDNSGAAALTEKLNKEINLLKKQLSLAQNAKPLSKEDKQELRQLVGRLEEENRELKTVQKKVTQENITMKTTVWAFTVIISILIVVGAYVMVNRDNNTSQAIESQAQSVPLGVTSHAQSAGKNVSCDNPVTWSQAKNLIDQQVAVQGTVAEYRYLPKVNGAPTWINLGAKYPNKNRFSVVIWGDYRNQFGRALSSQLVNRQICVVGLVKLWDGVPQIELKRPQELVFK